VLKRILPRGVKLGLNISPAHLQADSFSDDMLRFAAAARRPFSRGAGGDRAGDD
jgi:hypothetical protein